MTRSIKGDLWWNGHPFTLLCQYWQTHCSNWTVTASVATYQLDIFHSKDLFHSSFCWSKFCTFCVSFQMKKRRTSRDTASHSNLSSLACQLDSQNELSCQLQCFSVSLTFVSMVFLWRRQNSSFSRNNRVSRWNSTRRRRQRLISRLLLSMQVVNEMGLSLNLSFETQMDWHEMTNLVCRLFSFHSWLSWWHDPRVTLMPLTSMSSLLSCATYRSWLWCPSYSFDFCSGLPKSALIMKRKRKTHFETEEMIIKIRERVQRRVEGVLSLSS